ncbi:hypothetical protein [Actinoplanes sp. NPDC020271]|uniref:hypothetical protein n=1 Tax=Actinoplanes sp. NPDC020271 TaxID=3363896 RepID=UPI0037880503
MPDLSMWNGLGLRGLRTNVFSTIKLNTGAVGQIARSTRIFEQVAGSARVLDQVARSARVFDQVGAQVRLLDARAGLKGLGLINSQMTAIGKLAPVTYPADAV